VSYEVVEIAPGIEIDAEMFEKLESLEDTRMNIGFKWTPELEAVLLKYWPVKRKDDVAKIIGTYTQECRRKYRELTSE